MCHCFSGNDHFCFGQLFLIIAFHGVVITDSKVRSLYECPGQILIPIFGVCTAFLFTITVSGTANTTAVRGIITHLIESTNITSMMVSARINPIPSILVSRMNSGVSFNCFVKEASMTLFWSTLTGHFLQRTFIVNR